MSTQRNTHCIYLVPTGTGVGLTSISMGLVRALDRSGITAGFVKPVAQLFRGDTGPERSTYVIRNTTELLPPTPMPYEEADRQIMNGDLDGLMESIMENYQEVADHVDVVVEGLIGMDAFEHAAQLNQAIARTLDASVILVSAPRGEGMEKA